MVHPDWQGITTDYHSTEWYKNYLQYVPGDSRGNLTWRNRFSRALPKMWNFYSSGEEVLDNSPNTAPHIYNIVVNDRGLSISRYAWALQEKLKGRIDTHDWDYVPDGTKTLGSGYGGWGFNLTDPENMAHPVYYQNRASTMGYMLANRDPLSSAQISVINPLPFQLRAAPVFDPGWGAREGIGRNYNPAVLRGPSWIKDLYNESSDAVASAAENQHVLLAQMFPAVTFAAGRNEVVKLKAYGLSRNVDLNAMKSNAWPSDWHHSDIREVSYLYISAAFDELLNAGDLK